MANSASNTIKSHSIEGQKKINYTKKKMRKTYSSAIKINFSIQQFRLNCSFPLSKAKYIHGLAPERAIRINI